MVAVTPATSKEALANVAANAPFYYAAESDLTYRRRMILAMIEKYGGIERNAGSHSVTWNVEDVEPAVSTFEDSTNLTFKTTDKSHQLTTDYRGYRSTDRLSLKSQKMNQGSTRIEDLAKKKPEAILRAIRRNICQDIYLDGNGAGRTTRIHGMGSFLGAATGVTATDRLAAPSDSYAGISTALGQNGSTWETSGETYTAGLTESWPAGVGNANYDSHAPLLINTTSTKWNSGTASWRANCEEQIAFSGLFQGNRGARGIDDDAPYVHVLGGTLMHDFQSVQRDKGIQVQSHNDKELITTQREAMLFYGDMVTTEADCPSNEGFGFAPAMMDIFHLGDTMIEGMPGDWVTTEGAWLYLGFSFMNIRHLPKFYVHYKDRTGI